MIFGFLKSSTLSPRQLRLQNTSLFRSLKPLEIKFVDGLMHERRYLPDEIVFDEGEEGQALYVVSRNGAQHGAGFRLTSLPTSERNELIEQRQTIAHAAVGRLGDQAQTRRLERNVLFLEKRLHVLGDLAYRHALQVELQAPRQHRDG